METKQIDRFLLKTIYLVAVGIVVTQVFSLTSLTSMLFLLTFPLTVFMWVRTVRSTLTAMDLLMLTAAALAFVSVLLDAAFTGARLSFDYIKKAIMFVMTLMFLQTANRIRIGEDEARFIRQTADVLTVFLIAMFFLRNTDMHRLNGQVTRYLTFGFSNPNLTGLVLTCLYMLETYWLFLPKRWYWKLGHIIMAAFLVWFILESESRNCLLVMALYTAVCVWLGFRGSRKMYISSGMATLIAVFPVLFVAIYMLMISNQWIHETFSFLVDMGKDLDSRSAVWGEALNNLGRSPMIGTYYQTTEGNGFAQMHNTHLDIACSYGIPVLVLVCVLLQRYLHQNGQHYEDKESYLCILGFACALMLGIGEAALFSGSLGVYIFVGGFLILARRKKADAAGA